MTYNKFLKLSPSKLTSAAVTEAILEYISKKRNKATDRTPNIPFVSITAAERK